MTRQEVTEEQKTLWAAWVAERPPGVREIAERIKPWEAYLLCSTGQTCRILAIAEGPERPTVRVLITAGPNLGFEVYGVNPDDLVPIPVSKFLP